MFLQQCMQSEGKIFPCLLTCHDWCCLDVTFALFRHHSVSFKGSKYEVGVTRDSLEKSLNAFIKKSYMLRFWPKVTVLKFSFILIPTPKNIWLSTSQVLKDSPWPLQGNTFVRVFIFPKSIVTVHSLRSILICLPYFQTLTAWLQISSEKINGTGLHRK